VKRCLYCNKDLLDMNWSKKRYDKAQCCCMKCSADYKRKNNRTIFICPNCGKKMTRAYDSRMKAVSEYLWECKCMPDIIIHVG